MTGDTSSGVDVVVVGAGSCGCVVAERLSRDRQRTVLLLEAGGGPPGRHSLRLSHLPIGPGSDRAVHYSSAQGFDLPRGRGLGGSSVVNGGYFLRWHRSDFDDWSWECSAISAAYDDLDGGAGGGGLMNVSAFRDDELHAYAQAFEQHWRDEGFAVQAAPWPDTGVVRVRSNRDGGRRRPAASLVVGAIADRPNLNLVTGAEAIDVRLTGGRATGVRVGDQVIEADEVILCAGTLGTAELLSRTSGVRSRRMAVWEHRESLVRFTPADPGHRGADALLQTVLHTDDGMEIRCYNDDFANFIDGVPATGPAMGVALMHPVVAGSVTWDATTGLLVDLGDIGETDAQKLREWTERVRDMLDGPQFTAFASRPGAVIEPVVRTSQHAWGTLPMGVDTDWLGAVTAIPGLRVVDGSILPSSGSSGPHATVMMVATRIADELAS